MSDSKHTKGPWIIEKTFETLWIGTGKWGNTKVDEIVTLIENENDLKDEIKEKNLANAKLIAAAPELLEAAKEMCEAMGGGIQAEHDAYNKLMNVINKATT